MSSDHLTLHFEASEGLFRRVSGNDVFSATKTSGPKIKAQRLRYQLSVYRETRTTEDVVATADALRNGVARIPAGAVIGRARPTARTVCVDDPNPDPPCGHAHALIALVAEGTQGVDLLEVTALKADIADAFVISRMPSK